MCWSFILHILHMRCAYLSLLLLTFNFCSPDRMRFFLNTPCTEGFKMYRTHRNYISLPTVSSPKSWPPNIWRVFPFIPPNIRPKKPSPRNIRCGHSLKGHLFVGILRGVFLSDGKCTGKTHQSKIWNAQKVFGPKKITDGDKWSYKKTPI